MSNGGKMRRRYLFNIYQMINVYKISLRYRRAKFAHVNSTMRFRAWIVRLEITFWDHSSRAKMPVFWKFYITLN